MNETNTDPRGGTEYDWFDADENGDESTGEPERRDPAELPFDAEAAAWFDDVRMETDPEIDEGTPAAHPTPGAEAETESPAAAPDTPADADTSGDGSAPMASDGDPEPAPTAGQAETPPAGTSAIEMVNGTEGADSDEGATEPSVDPAVAEEFDDDEERDLGADSSATRAVVEGPVKHQDVASTTPENARSGAPGAGTGSNGARGDAGTSSDQHASPGTAASAPRREPGPPSDREGGERSNADSGIIATLLAAIRSLFGAK